MGNYPLMLLALVLTLSAPTIARAHASLDYPKGGEVFEPGDVITIKWSNEILHDPENWDLYFSSDGGATWTVLSQDMPVEKFTYYWTVPDINTTKGVIRIVQDNMTTDYDDINNTYFSIGDEEPDDPDVVTGTSGTAPPESSFELLPNYPNPAAAATSVSFRIPYSTHVSLKIYNPQGKLVATLVEEKLLRGKHTTTWNTTSLPPGLYLLRMKAGNYFATERVVVGG